MKKKIMTLLLSFLFILPCAFILVSCGEEKVEHNISVSTIQNGVVITNKLSAYAGETITLTVTADDGFELVNKSLRYNDNIINNNKFMMPDEDVVITARFIAVYSPERYLTINYHTDIYTNNPNPDKISYYDYLDLEEPSKDGYCFNGWFLDSDYNQKVERIKDSFVEYIDLYPKWEAIYKINNNTISSLTSYAKRILQDEKNLTIPYSIEGNIIDTIDKNAFEYIGLDTLTFGTNVKYLMEDAFKGCNIKNVYYLGELENWLEISFDDPQSTPLCGNTGSKIDKMKVNTNLYFNGNLVKNIYFSNNVKSVKKYAFQGFSFIENFYYSDTLENYLKVQFSNATSNPAVYGNLYINGKQPSGTINIPSGINYIQPASFFGCLDINAINLPDTVKFIGEYAFENCRNLNNINLEKVVYIYGWAFYNCYKLQRLNLELIQKIGEWAFSNCEKITSVAAGPYISEIGQYAFSFCKNLSSVIINRGLNLKTIDDCAFYYTNLSKIDLPASIKIIGTKAFAHSNLIEIKIPKYISIFNYDAISENSSLTTIIIDSEVAYNALTAKPYYTPSLTTFKVNKNIIKSCGENPFFQNYSKSIENDYYVFSRITN